MSRRSGVRIKTPFEVEIDFEVPVLSARAPHLRLVERVAPAALGVSVAGDDLQLARVLAGHPVVCAIVVDGSMPRLELTDLWDRVASRWAGLPVHLWLPAGATRPVDAAARATSLSLESDPEWRREEVLRAFLREALDQRLQWIAALLTFAYERGLTGSILETFVAYAIRQVHRDALAAHHCVSEAAVEKRVRGLCQQIGCDRLGHLGQLLLTVPPLQAPRGAIAMIESCAVERREAGREIHTWKAQ